MKTRQFFKELVARVRESFREPTFVVDGKEMTYSEMYQHVDAKRKIVLVSIDGSSGGMAARVTHLPVVINGLDFDGEYFIDEDAMDGKDMKLFVLLAPLLLCTLLALAWWRDAVPWFAAAIVGMVIILLYSAFKHEKTLRNTYPVEHDLFRDGDRTVARKWERGRRS